MTKSKEACEYGQDLQNKRMLSLTISFLFLFALLTQNAVAQETKAILGGFDFNVPTTNFGFTLQSKLTKEFYPNQNEYEADINTLLGSDPGCFDTNAYVIITHSYGCEVRLGILFGWEHSLPGKILRPHEDPRVVESWDQRVAVHGGMQIITDLLTEKSLGGSIEPLGLDALSKGGSY